MRAPQEMGERCSILLQPCLFLALLISCPATAVQDTAWSHMNTEKITGYTIWEFKKKFASKHKPMTVAMVCKHGIMASSHFFSLSFGYSHEPGRNPCQIKCMATTGVSRSLELSGVTTGRSLGRQHCRVRNKHLPGADFP